MELHRIVNRLLALEERRALGVRPVEHAAPVPHKVKRLVSGRRLRPADTVLEDVQDRTGLLHIPHHVLERSRGILTLAETAAHPFTELKDRLVELLTPSILDQCTSILWGVDLGGWRPTELLEVMMVALPPDKPAGHIFKTIFLHRLPGDLKDLVAVQFHQLEVRELAKFADIIWDTRNSKKSVVAAVQAATLEEDTTLGEETALERAIAALTIYNKKKWHGSKSRGGGCPRGGQGGGKGGSQGPKTLCDKHKKFREHAHYCSRPKTCSWSENE